jgi:hypothetical protein
MPRAHIGANVSLSQNDGSEKVEDSVKTPRILVVNLYTKGLSMRMEQL